MIKGPLVEGEQLVCGRWPFNKGNRTIMAGDTVTLGERGSLGHWTVYTTRGREGRGREISVTDETLHKHFHRPEPKKKGKK